MKNVGPRSATSRTKWHGDENAVNDAAKVAAAERLHQCLHQIAKSGERELLLALADSVYDTFGSNGVERLTGALCKRIGLQTNSS